MTAYSSRSMREKRRQGRHRAFLGGKILLDDGRSYDCVIRNISSDGALVEIAPDIIICNELILLNYSHAVAYIAQQIWRRTSRLGVRLLTAEDLKTTTSDRYERARQIWLAQRGIDSSFKS